MTTETLQEILAAGGEQTYPNGIELTAQAIISPTDVPQLSPATPGAIARVVAPVTWTKGNNLIQTNGAVDGLDLDLILDLSALPVSGWPGGKGSVLDLMLGAKAVDPTIVLELIDLYQGPGAAGGGSQPNGVQANSAGGMFNVSCSSSGKFPAPTLAAPFSVPDLVVFGGGPGFAGTIGSDDPAMVEFDVGPVTGSELTLNIAKILLGKFAANLATDPATPADWEKTLLHVTGLEQITNHTPIVPGSLEIRGTLDGQIVF